MKKVRTQTKRVLSVLLAVVLVVLAVPVAMGATTVKSGTFGNGFTWIYDSNHCLTIKGTGAMPDFSVGATDLPWIELKNYTAKVESLVFENGITRIGNYSFQQVPVKSISIPESVKSIGTSAFNYTLLTEAVIPASVTSIGFLAFAIPTFTKYIVSENNPVYSSGSDGCLYNKDKTELILYPAGSTRTSFSVPNTVKSISMGAFSSAMNLKSIQLPSSVKTIGFSAFSGCVNLNNVALSENLDKIDESAFAYCVSLKQITIPQSVTYIGFDAFWASGLNSITILNPNCIIDSISHHVINQDGTPVSYDQQPLNNNAFSDATIYGYDGSTAQQYAYKYGRSFVSLGSSPVPIVPPNTQDATDDSETDSGRMSFGQRIQNILNRILEFIRNLIYRLTHIF